jgi:hypothetical protein
MPIFQITPLGQNAAKVNAAVQRHVNEADRHQLANNAGWLIAYPGTSKELYGKLVSPEQEETMGSALVTLVSAYWGRGNTDMWEWLKTRFESRS